MKTFRFAFTRFVCTLFVLASAHAQIPNLEPIRALAISAASMASDGYGMHMIREAGGEVRHSLIDNN